MALDNPACHDIPLLIPGIVKRRDGNPLETGMDERIITDIDPDVSYVPIRPVREEYQIARGWRRYPSPGPGLVAGDAWQADPVTGIDIGHKTGAIETGGSARPITVGSAQITPGNADDVG